MPALVVAQGEADQALPGPGRSGRCAAVRSCGRRDPGNRAGRRRRRRRSARRAAIRPGCPRRSRSCWLRSTGPSGPRAWSARWPPGSPARRGGPPGDLPGRHRRSAARTAGSRRSWRSGCSAPCRRDRRSGRDSRRRAPSARPGGPPRCRRQASARAPDRECRTGRGHGSGGRGPRWRWPRTGGGRSRPPARRSHRADCPSGCLRSAPCFRQRRCARCVPRDRRRPDRRRHR